VSASCDTSLPVRFRSRQAGRKLSPQTRVMVPRVERGRMRDRVRQEPRPPYCAVTYVSIEATCPSSCRFRKTGACYVTAGITAGLNRKLDRLAQGMTGDQVMRLERDLLMRAFRGRYDQSLFEDPRDLRLHVGGDVSSTRGARYLAEAATDWRARGGGSVWTFTHRWRTVAREAWGTDISVLASVERVQDIAVARERGYPAAIVVPGFPSDRAFDYGGETVVPCPAETRGTTCVECRLCLDRNLLSMGVSIGFAVHGRSANRVRLPVVR